MYFHHKGQIESLNVNTRVPARIRYLVLLLAQDAGHAISWYYPHYAYGNAVLTEKFALNRLDPLLDFEYFGRDPGGDVMGRLSAAKTHRDGISQFVDS